MGEAQYTNLEIVNTPEQNWDVIDGANALGRSFALRSFAHTPHSRILLHCSVVPLATHLICTRHWVYCSSCSEYTKHLYVFFEWSECTMELSSVHKKSYHTTISSINMVRCKIVLLRPTIFSYIWQKFNLNENTAVCLSVPQQSSRTFSAFCSTPLCFVGQ
jgi:hypothetical protein